jgi:hypothetical protein
MVTDGRFLAAISDKGGCDIAIYAVGGDNTTAALTVRLELPSYVKQLFDGPVCTLFGLSWSPDGQTLVFGSTEGPYTLNALPLTSILPKLDSHRKSPATISVSPQMPIVLTGENAFARPDWMASSRVLTYIGMSSRGIDTIDVATRQPSQLFTQQVANIDFVSWVPDGTGYFETHRSSGAIA